MVEILESYLRSKKGKKDGGEDRLVLGPNFFGVVDGATDKSGNTWGTEEKPRKGGAVLADIVKTVLQDEGTSTDPSEIMEIINQQIHDAAYSAGINIDDEVNNRADTGFTAFVPEKDAVYHIHDCLFGFVKADGSFEIYDNDKEVDKLTSAVRATVIDWYINQGKDPFADGKDLGREAILPMLKRQPEIQNQGFNNQDIWAMGVPHSAVAYRTLNGFPTKIDVVTVPEGTTEIILATDGYRVIRPTLEETEAVLKKQLAQDPHCIGVLKSTKGLQPGNESFDDRTYLRLKL